jgi:glycosyltransferase involved in cell wall biosynthesis
MRILIVNDGFGDAGGVQTYLDAVVPALAARGHDFAVLHMSSDQFHQSADGSSRASSMPRIAVAEGAGDAALAAVRAWAPDVCFSHNMRDLDVEGRLIDVAPVVKFMHGYFGTCLGGQKMHRFPEATPCDRRLGAACLALYLPCGCGKRNPVTMLRHYRWASHQRSLFPAYAAVVVASEHMKREYVRNGVPAEQVHVTPLFTRRSPEVHAAPPSTASVAFCGRMTLLKGGDVLIDGAADAAQTLGRPVPLVMIGDGPSRSDWEDLARCRGVPARFTGWLMADALWRELKGAALLAVPSTWPEPFGLVGLEAGALGVPAIAFDVGGVREWLRDGVNGVLVAFKTPSAPALGAALADALSRPSLLGALRAGSLTVAREMSLARHIDRLEGILASCAMAPDRAMPALVAP